jgi:hypothetical protein
LNTFARTLLIGIFTCLIGIQFASAQQNSAAPAPIEAALVRKAKIAYVSNVGPDAASLVAFFVLARNKSEAPFNSFLSALKAWGRFDLTSAPGDSDIVIEFRVESALSDTGRLTGYSTFISLSIVDQKTHFVLSTIKAPLEVTKSFEHNADVSVAKIMDALKTLSAPANLDEAK